MSFRKGRARAASVRYPISGSFLPPSVVVAVVVVAKWWFAVLHIHERCSLDRRGASKERREIRLNLLWLTIHKSAFPSSEDDVRICAIWRAHSSRGLPVDATARRGSLHPRRSSFNHSLRKHCRAARHRSLPPSLRPPLAVGSSVAFLRFGPPSGAAGGDGGRGRHRQPPHFRHKSKWGKEERRRRRRRRRRINPI